MCGLRRGVSVPGSERGSMVALVFAVLVVANASRCVVLTAAEGA